MIIKILRGTNEIGGTCIQLSTESTTILLDLGESEDLAETASIRKALLEYCGLDTLAMVRILEKLKDLLTKPTMSEL